MTNMIAGMDQMTTPFADLQQRARQQLDLAPSWLRPMREAGVARFVDLGFPTRQNEDWRFTNVDPIAGTHFELPPDGQTTLDAGALAAHTMPALGGPVIVYLNGRRAPRLDLKNALPPDVTVVPLSEAIESHRDLVEKHLADPRASREDAFGALNAAFCSDGLFVHVPAGTAVERPIHVLNVSIPGAAPIMTHPRLVIVCEPDSRVSVVEHYVSHGDGPYLTNAITQIEAARGAVVEHYLIEEESRAAFNVSSLLAHQQANSDVASHTVLLGGGLVRNNIRAVLDGERCDCLINGLFVGSGTQHLDNFMRVEHAAPRCDSRQFYKGILDDRAHGVFSGRIHVDKVAQKTDAKQTNANLLLSDGAQIDSKPQLEIYADDVKCTHGATIGQIDEDAVFYLRTRGIHEAAARALVIYAFAAESFERMRIEAVRDALVQKLLARLPQGDLLASIL